MCCNSHFCWHKALLTTRQTMNLRENLIKHSSYMGRASSVSLDVGSGHECVNATNRLIKFQWNKTSVFRWLSLSINYTVFYKSVLEKNIIYTNIYWSENRFQNLEMLLPVKRINVFLPSNWVLNVIICHKVQGFLSFYIYHQNSKHNLCGTTKTLKCHICVILLL